MGLMLWNSLSLYPCRRETQCRSASSARFLLLLWYETPLFIPFACGELEIVSLFKISRDNWASNLYHLWKLDESSVFNNNSTHTHTYIYRDLSSMSNLVGKLKLMTSIPMVKLDWIEPSKPDKHTNSKTRLNRTIRAFFSDQWSSFS